MYQRVCTQTRRKYIDINKVAKTLGKKMCTALVGLHAFTGCDSISACVDKGKLQTLKVQQNVAKGTTLGVNKCRYQLFCTNRGDINLTQLPPCRDCQAGVWRRSLECQPKIPRLPIAVGARATTVLAFCGWLVDQGNRQSWNWCNVAAFVPVVPIIIFALQSTSDVRKYADYKTNLTRSWP